MSFNRHFLAEDTYYQGETIINYCHQLLQSFIVAIIFWNALLSLWPTCLCVAVLCLEHILCAIRCRFCLRKFCHTTYSQSIRDEVAVMQRHIWRLRGCESMTEGVSGMKDGGLSPKVRNKDCCGILSLYNMSSSNSTAKSKTAWMGWDLLYMSLSSLIQTAEFSNHFEWMQQFIFLISGTSLRSKLM